VIVTASCARAVKATAASTAKAKNRNAYFITTPSPKWAFIKANAMMMIS
jgi:hypothetical protein